MFNYWKLSNFKNWNVGIHSFKWVIIPNSLPNTLIIIIIIIIIIIYIKDAPLGSLNVISDLNLDFPTTNFKIQCTSFKFSWLGQGNENVVTLALGFSLDLNLNAWPTPKRDSKCPFGMKEVRCFQVEMSFN